MVAKLENDPAFIIRFADCAADLLFLAGSNDRSIDSVGYAKRDEQMMKSREKSNFQVVVYEGMGHMCNCSRLGLRPLALIF